MNSSPEKISEPELLSEKEKKEKELMSQVFFLLEHLTEREEVTIKIILDCLYDIGSINLIDHKLSVGFFNKTMKPVARISKPLFKMLAIRWFKKNCPQLITDWLYTQVTFNDDEKEEEVVEKALPQARIQEPSPELDLLRSQVKLLTVILIGVIGIFGGGFIWLGYSFQQEQQQLISPGKSATFLGNEERLGD